MAAPEPEIREAAKNVLVSSDWFISEPILIGLFRYHLAKMVAWHMKMQMQHFWPRRWVILPWLLIVTIWVLPYKPYCMTNHNHVISSRDHLSEFKQKTFNIVTYFQINILFHDAYDTLNILLYSINLFFSVLEMPQYDLKTQFGPENDLNTPNFGQNSPICINNGCNCLVEFLGSICFRRQNKPILDQNGRCFRLTEW